MKADAAKKTKKKKQQGKIFSMSMTLSIKYCRQRNLKEEERVNADWLNKCKIT